MVPKEDGSSPVLLLHCSEAELGHHTHTWGATGSAWSPHPRRNDRQLVDLEPHGRRQRISAIARHHQGGLHITDITNASRTMMMNIRTHDWDDELLAIVGVDRSILPRIVSCSEVYGVATGCLEGVKIAGISGIPFGCRIVGRPAGSAVWTDLFWSGRDEEHVRDRMFHSDEHGRLDRGESKRVGHNSSLQDRHNRENLLCVGRFHHDRRSLGAVAAGQSGHDSVE